MNKFCSTGSFPIREKLKKTWDWWKQVLLMLCFDESTSTSLIQRDTREKMGLMEASLAIRVWPMLCFDVIHKHLTSLSQVAEEPRLPAAYIRNLVKQLTLLGVKDGMKQKEHLGSSLVDGRPHDSIDPPTLGESQQAQPPQPSKHKKQIRRRLLTSGPYEEDSLDMASARREVVTALRLHRASMYQNSDNHHQQATPQPRQKRKSKSRKNSKQYDFSTTPNFSNNLYNLSYQSFPYQPPQTSYTWSMCVSAPPPIPEDFNLPNQTLGLNLNLQDFDGLDTTVLQNNYIPARCYSSTSPSTSNSFPLSVAREETPYVGLSQAPLVADPSVEADLGLHHTVDDEEMAEIRSVGENHQIEWDDTVHMVTSAWWSDFLNTKENGTSRFGMESPPWLNTNDNCFQQLDEHYSSYYFQDPTLPQMDVGEVEGMDGEWLG
ncbi:Dual specificity protein kinase splA [Heracleum sosnowskyi]|uniref:Dual specificity protein kinase splA n=1 Tax=Heracleum sosnowskyi TaxID=360622 RepID=A0AAD8HKN1_9APIA|nr:Dual specificity protein kinase splA [Heracleum sosnowskyi]